MFRATFRNIFRNMFGAKTFTAVLTFFASLLASALLWGGGGGFPTAFTDATTVISTGGITLSGPELMAVDSLGNLYIADTGNSQIVEVTATGVASVVSFPGLSPALAGPTAVAVDGAGNLYVADSSNARVVELSAGVASVINTASLLSNPDGVAVDAAGDLYISDATNNDIVKVPAGGSAALLSISGLVKPLAQPFGLALDLAGNLYIADSGNSQIVKVTTGGAGSVYFTTSLTQPEGVAVDALGNLYIADTSDTLIITASPTGVFNVVRMPGFSLSVPEGVAVGVWGAVYIADTGNNRILEAQPTTVGFGHLQYGVVSGTTQTLNVTIGFGTTFGSVQAFTQGTAALDFTVTATTCVAGTTTNAACTVNIQFLPTAAGFRKGTMVIYNNATPAAPIISVPLYGMADAPLATLSPGAASVISTGEVATETPFQITEDGAGNMYVANYEGNNVLKIPPGGGSATVVSLGGELTTSEIAGVAIDGAGNLFICDHFDSRIIEVTPGGVASVLSITGLSTGLDIPTGLTVDAANNLYISDYGNSRVVKVTPSGAGSVVATPGFTPAVLSVLGVAVDGAGTVYFPDAENNRIIKVTAAGAASLVVTEGLTPVLSSPQGVAVDGFGNLYIADAGNDRLVEVTSAGVASVMPTPGLTDPSTLGTFYAIAADASGNILVPDFSNSRIVELNVTGASLAFPNTGVGSTSSPQTATVTNIGDLPLVFAANPAYTANFSENSGDENLCAGSTSLAAGEDCDVSVEFTPQSAGSLSAGITLTNNNLNGTNATESVAVSGTGTLATTSTVLAASPNPAIAGQSVLLTASVSPAPTGSPLGSVSFYDGATLLGSGNLNSSGIATFTTSTLPVGANSLTAIYSGNASFATSSSTLYTETITSLTSTTTALTAIPNPATVGQSVALTATVTPVPLEPEHARSRIPEEESSLGTVSFYFGETLLGSGNLNSSGVATLATISLPAGADGLTAVYSGDTGFAASTSSVFTETITAPTSTTLTAAPNPAQVGQSVTLTATVSPAPTGSSLGTVSFYDGETLLGSGNVNSAGVTTFTSTSLPAGANSLTAVYSGNSGFAASTSSVFTETITAATSTTTTLIAAPNPAQAGQSVTLTATISPAPTGSSLGTVSFYDGETLLGSGNVNSAGVATFTSTSLPAGANSLTAVYSGNSGFAASTSSGVTQTITTSIATTTTLTTSPNPATSGNTVTFTATISPVPTGSSLGTVSFYSGSALLGTASINSSGVATFTSNSLPTGALSITAAYSGNTAFAGSTSSALTETVSTTYTVTAPPAPVTVSEGGSVEINVTVPPVGGAFDNVVTMSASGLPPGATATFNPPTVTPGSAGAPTVMTIQLASLTAKAAEPHRNLTSFIFFFGLCGIGFGGKRFRRKSKRGLALLVLALAASSSLACGGGFLGPPTTRAGSYVVTITGTSGAAHVSATVTVVVQ